MPHFISKAGHLLTQAFHSGSVTRSEGSHEVKDHEPTDLHHGSNLDWFSLTAEKSPDALGDVCLLSLQGDRRRPTPPACSSNDVM